MNAYLYFCFQDMEFALYAEDSILLKLESIWVEISAKVLYGDCPQHAWKIISEYSAHNETKICWKHKCIYHYHTNPYLFFENNSLIKEIIIKFALSKGFIWVHGSVFRVKNKTILILGSKGSGKTTWLMTSLLKCNGQFICNDQLPLYLKKGKLFTCKWRSDIKVSPDTLKCIKNVPMDDCDRYLIFPQNKQLEVFDITTFSQLTNQKISKCFTIPVSTDSLHEYNIDYVICLSSDYNSINKLNSSDMKYFWDKYFASDTEVITPEKFLEWDLHIPYWNKRIKKLPVIPNGLTRGKKIIKELLSTQSYGSNNRLPIDKIQYFIMQLGDI